MLIVTYCSTLSTTPTTTTTPYVLLSNIQCYYMTKLALYQ